MPPGPPPNAQIPSLDALLDLVRTSPAGARERTAALVNRWYDEHPGEYARGTIAAKLGSHRRHFDAYRLLATERRAALHRRAVAICAAEGRHGLDAGGFMLGRLVGSPHPVRFWSLLADGEVAFVVDEWVLHLGYLSVLDEVGEREIRAAGRLLLERGVGDVRVTAADVKSLMALKLSERDLDRVARLVAGFAHAGTLRALDLLREPYRSFYDFDAPWSVGPLRAICSEAGLALPSPDDA